MEALAELDKAEAVESDEGNVARQGLVDEGLRRRPEGLLFGQLDEVFKGTDEVEIAGLRRRRGG